MGSSMEKYNNKKHPALSPFKKKCQEDKDKNFFAIMIKNNGH